MKKLVKLLLLLVLTACNHSTNPDNPVSPVNPETPIVYSTGLVKPENRAFGVMHFIPKRFLGELPKEFSWEDKGFTTPVRDQGSCGSCWAFGGTQTIEMGYKIFGGKDIDFSEQDLVGKLFYGCGGGYFTGDFQVSKGQADEASCPYTASNKKCSQAKPAGKGVSSGLVGKPNRSPTDEELQNAIMTYGAIAATVAAGGGFMSYKGGLSKSCPGGSTNHIIALTGWKTGPDNKIYFKIKNSWGTSWGEGGYGYFRAGCYALAEEASWLAVDAVPCKPPLVKLPSEYIVKSGDEVVLAVRKIEGAIYSWYEGTTKLSDSNELIVIPQTDTVYRVIVKNNCGEAEIQTLVVLK